MANPTVELISALKETATRLRNGANYAWGNHGACNCGNLLQVVSQLTKQEILQYAHTGTGEWTELAEDFCPTSNAPIGLLLNKLQQIGLTPTDIHHLEYLDNKQVLLQLPNGFRWLKKNVREDVIVYFETFANMLEDKLQQSIKVDFNSLFSAETKYQPTFKENLVLV